MYKTSIPFIKAQIPNTSIEQLLKFYADELDEQQVSEIQIENDCVSFSTDTFKFIRKPYFITRYKNKFDGFSSGRIYIEDTGREFWVTIKADESRTFIPPVLLMLAPILFLLAGSGFRLFSLIILLVIYLIVSVLLYVSLLITFPIYFTSLRNRLEQKIAASSPMLNND